MAAALPTPSAGAEARLASLPLRFEPNVGQADPSVRFVARTPRHAFFLTGTEAVAVLRGGASGAGTIRMQLVGADPTARIEGLDPLAGVVNSFIGRDPDCWRSNVPTYSRVRVQSAVPGVDVEFHGDGDRVEFDLIVAPATDPGSIALRFRGARSMSLDARGDLALHAADGDLLVRRPVTYQEIDGVRHEIASAFEIRGDQLVGFEIAAHDQGWPLVIDPTLDLVTSTYLGGLTNEQATGIAVDAAGSTYVCGWTDGLGIPVEPPGSFLVPRGNRDAFVAKLNPAGNDLVYFSYVGGAGNDVGHALAVDAAGSAYLTGENTSTDFPQTFGAYVGTFQGSFVVKLAPSGDALEYATTVGHVASGVGLLSAIALDSSGNAYVAGSTQSPTFPTVNPIQAGPQGDADAFVYKLSSTGAALLYSTYLGGSQRDFGKGIAVDAAGSAHVAGTTLSGNFPVTAGALQSGAAGSDDAFVAKLSPDGSALEHATYVGGNAAEDATGIAIDDAGSAYLVGRTQGGTFPVTAGARQVAYGGGNLDGFVSKLSGSGSSLLYSTYLGGSCDDTAQGIAVDASGSAFVTGAMSIFASCPSAFPGTTCFGTCAMGDAFVLELDPAGAVLMFSALLGSSNEDQGNAIALGPNGDVHVTGYTQGANFPTVAAVQPAPGHPFAGYDGFVARLRFSPALLLQELLAQVEGMDLPNGTERSLVAKLEAASASQARGNTTAAKNQARAFGSEVSALRGKKIPAALADDLIAGIQAFGASLP